MIFIFAWYFDWLLQQTFDITKQYCLFSSFYVSWLQGELQSRVQEMSSDLCSRTQFPFPIIKVCIVCILSLFFLFYYIFLYLDLFLSITFSPLLLTPKLLSQVNFRSAVSVKFYPILTISIWRRPVHQVGNRCSKTQLTPSLIMTVNKQRKHFSLYM